MAICFFCNYRHVGQNAIRRCIIDGIFRNYDPNRTIPIVDLAQNPDMVDITGDEISDDEQGHEFRNDEIGSEDEEIAEVHGELSDDDTGIELIDISQSDEESFEEYDEIPDLSDIEEDNDQTPELHDTFHNESNNVTSP